MQEICECQRTEPVATVDGVIYVRCLDCQRIFEAEDSRSEPRYDSEDE